MIYDVIAYPFNRADNEMTDGDHYKMEAMSATQAVLNVIKLLKDYDPGTLGYDEYQKLTEITT